MALSKDRAMDITKSLGSLFQGASNTIFYEVADRQGPFVMVHKKDILTSEKSLLIYDEAEFRFGIARALVSTLSPDPYSYGEFGSYLLRIVFYGLVSLYFFGRYPNLGPRFDVVVISVSYFVGEYVARRLKKSQRASKIDETALMLTGDFDAARRFYQKSRSLDSLSMKLGWSTAKWRDGADKRLEAIEKGLHSRFDS